MSVRAHIGAIAQVLEELDVAAPGERARARHLMQEVLEAHRDGLARLLETLGPDVAQRICADDEIGAMLMLHGLHKVDLRTRIVEAIDKLAPRLAAQHGKIELIDVTSDAHVRVRVEHAGKRGAFHAQIEEALTNAAADATELTIDEVISVPVKLDRLQRGARR